MRWTAALLLLASPLSAAEPIVLSPADGVALAAGDILRVPIADRYTTRFIWLGHLSPKARESLTRVLAGHINGLSTEPDISLPVAVPGTAGALLRINCEDYGEGYWFKVFERLKDEDPYFHAAAVETVVEVVEVQVQYGRKLSSGKWVDLETRVEKQQRKRLVRKEQGQAPWIKETPEQKAALKILVEATQSEVPIVLGDWFLTRSAIQAERAAGYYDFLGVKNEADFLKLVASVQGNKKRKGLREAVSRSGIVPSPRRIAVFDAPGLHHYKTFDQFENDARDKKNPLRVLDDDNFEFAASEQYGGLPNGLWTTGLFDNKGVRQDSVPDKITGHKFSLGNNTRLHVNKDCLSCHNPKGGLMPIDAWVRGLYAAGYDLTKAYDPKTARDLRQKYRKELEGPMEGDREAYARVLFTTTQMTPAKYGVAYQAAFDDYEYGPVTAARAAALLGVSEAKMRAEFKKTFDRWGTLDPILLGIVSGKPTGIREFEEAYVLGQLALRGFVQPLEVKQK
jgi:hypothetical protein